MSLRFAFRISAAALLGLAVVWLVVSCASAPKAPEPTPTPTATPMPTPEATPTPAPTPTPAVKALSEDDFHTAQVAIDEAVAAGAEAFAADLLNQARQALSQARDQATTAPDDAKALLATSVTKAHEARDAALQRFDQDAAKAIDEATAAGADKLATDLLSQAQKALDQARTKGDRPAAETRALYQTAIDKAHAARDAALVQAQLAQMDKDAQAAIDEAVAAGADQLAADLLAQARSALDQARQKASDSPAEAKNLYQDALNKAHAARDAALAAKTKAVLDQLDQQATQAIAEAEAVEADQWAPVPLGQARNALTSARDQAAKSPDLAQKSYQTAIDQAHTARDTAAAARTQALLAKLDAAVTAWKALQPVQWTPDEAQVLGPQAESARTAVAADYSTGLPLATDALAALGIATDKLKNRLAAVQDVRTKAQKALGDAEAANDAFFQGTGAWRKYHLDAAEEAWTSALYQAQSAQAKALAEVERKRTEKLMLDTMKKIEDASGKTVVDPNDNIIAPQPWDGKKELEKLQPKPLSLVIPPDGSVVVLGEKQRVTYLDEAKDQWTQGVKALDAGDLTLANQAFLEAQKLIDTYLAMAVDSVYTVQLNPDKRDSLWRIAGHGDIYDTPWEWPKIWKRNQKLIQNPDLIYPGWQLIIPPQ